MWLIEHRVLADQPQRQIFPVSFITCLLDKLDTFFCSYYFVLSCKIKNTLKHKTTLSNLSNPFYTVPKVWLRYVLKIWAVLRCQIKTIQLLGLSYILHSCSNCKFLIFYMFLRLRILLTHYIHLFIVFLSLEEKIFIFNIFLTESLKHELIWSF